MDRLCDRFSLEESEHEWSGAALRIKRPVSVSKISIEYETSSKSPSLEWLPAELTAGKEKPYLYSQGQAVLNRAFFPCQDTPSVKW